MTLAKPATPTLPYNVVYFPRFPTCKYTLKTKDGRNTNTFSELYESQLQNLDSDCYKYVTKTNTEDASAKSKQKVYYHYSHDYYHCNTFETFLYRRFNHVKLHIFIHAHSKLITAGDRSSFLKIKSNRIFIRTEGKTSSSTHYIKKKNSNFELGLDYAKLREEISR